MKARKTAKIAAVTATAFLLICTIIGGYAHIIPPSVWALPQLICLSLPALSVLTLVVGIVWLIGRRYVMAELCAAALIIIIPALMVVFPVSFPKKPAPEAPTLSLLTYNVHNCMDIDDSKRGASRTLDYVINSNADVICLQELYSLAEALRHHGATIQQVRAITDIYPYTVEPYNSDIDVCIRSKYPLTKIAAKAEPALAYFMFEAVRVEKPGHPVTVVNVHLTSYGLSDSERNVFADQTGFESVKQSAGLFAGTIYGKLKHAFENRARAAKLLAEFLDTLDGDIIVCGDFNDVPASYAYNTITKEGYHDAFCEASIAPTFTFNAHHLYFHIDQILYKGHLRPYDIKRGDLRASDHFPLTAYFELM